MVTGTLVDTNIFLDLFTEDPTWIGWSTEALAEAAERGPLWINPIIYAEASVRFSRIEDLEEALPASDFGRAALPWEAAFLAAKAFAVHRRRGGRGGTTLPDFFIGAHAAVAGLDLLTRDAKRYRRSFPTVQVHAPN